MSDCSELSDCGSTVRKDVHSTNVSEEYGKTSALNYGSRTLLGHIERSYNQQDLGHVDMKFEVPTPEKVLAKGMDPTSIGPGFGPDKTCRICLGGTEDEGSLGRLISPCHCKGTMRYVHIECLNRWRLRSQKKTSFFQCDECRYKYAFRRTTIAKYATNELVLTLVTLMLFAFCVLLGGFFSKLFLYLNGYSGFSSDSILDDLEDKELEIQEPMTFTNIFIIDFYHLIYGFVFVGIVGLIQIVFSLCLLGPFPSWSIRLPSGNSVGGGGRGDSVTALVVTVILVLGAFKAMWGIYKLVKGLSRLILERVELVILEVNEL